MDVTPDLHFLESRKNDRLGWHDCMAELIDNSFDAGATRVVLHWSGKNFTVEDDGRGMPDVSAAVKFGSHRKHSTTNLGMFGVGLKDAWLWLSDTFSIRTTRDGKTIRLTAGVSQWTQVDGRWVGPDPVVNAALSGEVGTALTFGPLYRNRTAAGDEAISKLGVTFMPALNSGKQIVVVRKNGGRKAIVAFRLPAMQESIEETFIVDGKSVTIQIGIAQEGEQIIEPGFLVCYKHRVIKSGSQIGTKHYNASRMVGRIVLGSGWALTPHKNDFSDYSDELADAVYERISGMLAKEDQMSDALESNAIRSELESMLNSSLKGLRGKGKRPGKRDENEPPSIGIPRGTGRKHRKAKVVNTFVDGDVEPADPQKRRNGLSLKWQTFQDTTLLGRYDFEAKSVTLNLGNEFIANMKSVGNRLALLSVAAGILCYANDHHDGEQKLLECKGTFAQAWGEIMASLRTESKQCN